MRDLEKVCIQPKYNYCTSEERFTFIKLPKCLVENECFIELSMDAKLLCTFFLERVSLSIKNGWIDNQGRVFIYYSIKNICEDLNCGTHKATEPNEVWMWNIIYLNGQILGKHYYLYLFSDLYSRKIIGWEVWENENAEHASELVKRIYRNEKIYMRNIKEKHPERWSGEIRDWSFSEEEWLNPKQKKETENGAKAS